MSPEQILEQAKDLSPEEIAELLWEIDEEHYVERPVDINTFIDDPTFLGDVFEEDFYPYWREQLNKLYPSPFYSPYYEAITLLPIGSGKTTTANVSIMYDLYRVHCLHDPHSFYNIKPRTVPIVFALLSASKALAENVNWASLEGMLEGSPWFREKCPLNPVPNRRIDDESFTVELPKNTGIVLGSSARHVLGKAVFGGELDEAEFQKVKSNQAHNSYLGILRRMESRFLKTGGVIPGHLWLMSSPKLSTDFLSGHIATQAKSPRTFIIQDSPIWEINKGTTKDIYSGKTFRVFVGDKNRDPQMLEEGQTLTDVSPGDIMDVPEEYYQSFLSNLIDAIKDIIGRSATGATNLFRQKSIIIGACTLKHRFSKEIIELDFFDPGDTIMNYADLDYFRNPMFKYAYRFIHVDLGITNDKLGMGSTLCIPERKVIHSEVNIESHKIDLSKMTQRMYYTDWVLTIKAKAGQEIPFNKVLAWLIFLRNIGFPIKLISFDQFQSRHMQQELKLQNISTQHVSVDGTRDPYHAWAQAALGGFWVGPKNEVVIREAIDLRDDGEKIDHPINGAKDTTDGIAGSFWSCLNSPDVTVISGSMDTPPKSNQDLKSILLDEMQKRTVGEAFKNW